MVDYVIAGASSIGDIPRFLGVAGQAGLDVLLVENEVMWRSIPAAHQSLVICSEEIAGHGSPTIPLNEFWVSQAIRGGVPNISTTALRASRSKHYLSARLAQCGLPAVPRYYLDDLIEPWPLRYLARLDAGYSGYGVVRHVEFGNFDPRLIRRAVDGDASASMRTVLGEEQTRVVVEDWLDGEEYSADVFVDRGKVNVLRLFRKTVAWVNGRPVCDSYIAVPCGADLHAAIIDWCAALFSKSCISFGQFDFIVTDKRTVAIDFSCRIGGGLDAIKRFVGISSYIAMALSGSQPYFAPFTVQKNLVARRAGRLAKIVWSLPSHFQVTVHKHEGDPLPENICSANARVAEVCFVARNFEKAVAMARQLDKSVTIDVRD